jgi:hypothetical protein
MLPQWSSPSEQNEFLSEHVALLLRSFRHCLGWNLVDNHLSPAEQARELFLAPFVVVSHDTAPDPVFNYANQAALTLFAMSWEEFTTLPSRQSAPPLHRNERARLLAAVTGQGYIADYRGLRIAKTGQRFVMEDGIVWNVRDAAGRPYGQAATFSRWTFVP